MEINSYLLREQTPAIVLGANGTVGTAAETVDIVSNLGVTASATGLTFTLPAPTDTRSGRSVLVMNTGVNQFSMYANAVKSGQYIELIWGAEDSSWHSPSVPQESAADFWRSGSLTGSTPDGVTDTQDAIFHNGQAVIDTGTATDSGLTLAQLTTAVVPTLGAEAIGVTASGKIVRHVTDLYRDRGMPNTLMTLSGVATFSRTNFLKWTNKFFILGGGRGAGTLSTAGYYEIGMPPVGTVIQGVGGIPNQTVSASGIDMRASAGSWSVLYYILNAGGQATVNANFRLAGWQSDFVVPDNWVMVGAYNADNLTVKLGNGQLLKQGTDTDGFITPFDATIDFSVNTDPNTAGTTFSPNTPANGTVVYVSTINGAQWTYNGTAYIAAPASADWRTTGNTATNQATNFLGTTDDVGLSFRTRNQIRQTITNVGDVGIGVTVPLSRLSIVGGNNQLGFYSDQTTLNQGKQAIIKIATPGIGDGHLAFETYSGGFGGGERMRITRRGDVGIGTTTPLNTLHIGSATVPNTGGVRLPITSASGAQTGQPIGVDANGDIVRLTPTTFDATVDFNQATPTTPGVVFTPNTPASTTVLYVSSTNGSQWTYNGSAYVAAPAQPAWQTTGNAGTVQATNFVGTTDNVGLSLRTNNQIRQTITNAGNVGIGTITPASKLDVAAAATTVNSVVNATGSINDFLQYNVQNTSTGTQAQSGYSATADNGTATTGFAWMGINNSAFNFPTTYNAGVAGDVTYVGSGQDLIIANANQTKAIKFQTGKAAAPFFDDRMTIINNGNVGLGTITPAAKLQVSLTSSNANPPTWTSSHAAFTIGGGNTASGLGIGYDTTANEAWIASLTPNSSWRPLRFHGTAWKFVSNGTIEAFTIAANSSVGVNVTNPVQKLEVGGNIRATGIANYASTAAALADAALLTGTMYTVNVAGVKQLYVK